MDQDGAYNHQAPFGLALVGRAFPASGTEKALAEKVIWVPR